MKLTDRVIEIVRYEGVRKIFKALALGYCLYQVINYREQLLSRLSNNTALTNRDCRQCNLTEKVRTTLSLLGSEVFAGNGSFPLVQAVAKILHYTTQYTYDISTFYISPKDNI